MSANSLDSYLLSPEEKRQVIEDFLGNNCYELMDIDLRGLDDCDFRQSGRKRDARQATKTSMSCLSTSGVRAFYRQTPENSGVSSGGRAPQAQGESWLKPADADLGDYEAFAGEYLNWRRSPATCICRGSAIQPA